MPQSVRRPRALAREIPEQSRFRQLSETMLEFGTPLLRELPDGVALERIRTVLRGIIDVWNALVLAESGRPQMFHSLVNAGARNGARLSELTALAGRRKQYFSHDHRVVQHWSLEYDPVDPAGLRLVAHVSSPSKSDGTWTHRALPPAN